MQEAYGTPNREDKREFSKIHSQNTKCTEERVLKAAREKSKSHIRHTFRITPDFSMETENQKIQNAYSTSSKRPQMPTPGLYEQQNYQSQLTEKRVIITPSLISIHLSCSTKGTSRKKLVRRG